MNIYKKITDIIIASLEKGVIPWKKPWNQNSSFINHQNFVTKIPYGGINPFILEEADFSSPYWLTYKQATALNASIIKGSKATTVIFWKMLKGKNWTINAEGKKVKEKFPMLRYYSVFNIEQITGIDKAKIPVIKNDFEELNFNLINKAETIINGYEDKPEIVFKGSSAFYRGGDSDVIVLPPKENFQSCELFYGTFFHELIHSTGHASRLNRQMQETQGFDSGTYAKEELTAEMGAAFLCAFAGIDNSTISQSKAYIQNWLTRLKDDEKLVIQAAARAQKASKYILKTQYQPK